MKIPRGIQFWPTKLAEQWFKEYQRSQQFRKMARRRTRKKLKAV